MIIADLTVQSTLPTYFPFSHGKFGPNVGKVIIVFFFFLISHFMVYVVNFIRQIRLLRLGDSSST